MVAGLSGGGAISEWLLSERSDVEQAIAISPFLQPTGTPRWQIRPLYRATRFFDATHWWDAEKKERFGADNPHSNGYPRTTYRGLAAYMTLGQWATDRIERTGQPAAGNRAAESDEGAVAWPSRARQHSSSPALYSPRKYRCGPGVPYGTNATWSPGMTMWERL